jgi:hypothetical protein
MTRVSYQLLRTSIPPAPEEVSLFEWTIPQVRLSNGVYRTTRRGRFRSVDKFVNKLMSDHFAPSAPLKIQDWAASDCLASSEWYFSLAPHFPNARLTASDLVLFLIECRLPSGEAFILEPSGEPLQYIRPPFVARLSPPEPWLFVMNRLVQIWARRKFDRLRSIWSVPLEWLRSNIEDNLHYDGLLFLRIPLVHPEAEALRRSTDSFSICTQTVFETSPEPCHVIRTMNILQPCNFAEDKLLEGVRTVWNSLWPGGIWIVGRTIGDDAPCHGVSVFCKTGDGFRLLDRFGEGSEIEDLALGFSDNYPTGEQARSLYLKSLRSKISDLNLRSGFRGEPPREDNPAGRVPS